MGGMTHLSLSYAGCALQPAGAATLPAMRLHKGQQHLKPGISPVDKALPLTWSSQSDWKSFASHAQSMAGQLYEMAPVLSLLPLSYIDRKAVSGGNTANRWMSCRMKCGRTSSLLCMLAATRYRSACSSRHPQQMLRPPGWATQTRAGMSTIMTTHCAGCTFSSDLTVLSQHAPALQDIKESSITPCNSSQTQCSPCEDSRFAV